MKDKTKDQCFAVFILIAAAVCTIVTRSGGQPGTPSYIETHYVSSAQMSEDRFCLEFARSISGTVEYKQSIYQDCKGD